MKPESYFRPLQDLFFRANLPASYCLASSKSTFITGQPHIIRRWPMPWRLCSSNRTTSPRLKCLWPWACWPVSMWQQGVIPCLERVITCHLNKASRILRLMGFLSLDLNKKPSPGIYQGKRGFVQFTKTGNSKFEISRLCMHGILSLPERDKECLFSGHVFLPMCWLCFLSEGSPMPV